MDEGDVDRHQPPVVDQCQGFAWQVEEPEFRRDLGQRPEDIGVP